MTRRRGTIRRRAKGWYAIASVTDQAGARHRPRQGPFPTRRDAEAALGQMMADLDRGGFVLPNRTPLADYLTTWLDVHRWQLRPSTANGYEGVVRRYVQPFIGAVSLKDVRPQHLNDLYAGMVRRGLSPRTVRTVHVVVRRALSDAVREGLITRNVADAAVVPRPKRIEMKTWTAADLRRFLEAVQDDPLYPAMHLAAFTGMRRGEVCGLRWSDVDLERARLALSHTVIVVAGSLVEGEPKTERGRRVVDLDPVTVGVLRTWKAQQAAAQLATGSRNDRVFQVHPEVLSAVFDRLVRQAGLPRIRFHDLRHTHVSLLAAAGVPPHVISARVGHATVGFTLTHYSHVLPGHQADAAALVARAVLGDVR